MYSHKDYITFCLSKIGERNTWGEPHEWTERTFRKLSELALNEYNFQISVSTIKRIKASIVRNNDYLPQEATLNALSKIAGYLDWDELKKNAVSFNENNKANSYDLKSQIIKKRLIVISVVAAFILLFIFMMINKESENQFIYRHDIDLVLTKKESKALSTIGIMLKPIKPINDEDSINLVIEDKYYKDTVRITGNLLTYNHQFKYPGVHRVKLIQKDSIIEQVHYVSSSDKWFLACNKIKDKNTTSRLSLIDYDSIAGDKSNVVLNYIEKDKLIPDNYWFGFEKVKEFSVNGNDLSFSCLFKSKSISESSCKDFIVILEDRQKRKIRIHLVEKGCRAWLYEQFSDSYTRGKWSNLSRYELNMKEKNKLHIRTKNNHVKVYLNDKMVDNVKYALELQNICSVSLISKGLCQVDSVKLDNLYLN